MYMYVFVNSVESVDLGDMSRTRCKRQAESPLEGVTEL